MLVMLFIDDLKLQEFWDNLSKGFRKSPLEYLLFLGLIAAIIILPLLLFLFFQIRNRRKILKASLERFRNIVQQKGLAPEEAEALDKMARYFPRDKRFLPDLLTHAHTFNACLKRLQDKERIDDALLARIRMKLGLSTQASQHQLHSTAEFSSGIAVKLNLLQGRTVRGKIQAVDEQGLTVATEAQAGEGQLLMLELDTRSGYYLVHTQVIEKGDDWLKVAHSERIERIQNRKYYRKTLRLPVVLRIPEQAEQAISSFLLDLSGGGAKVHNPGIKTVEGMVLVLIIKLASREDLVLPSRVARVSDKDSTLSLSFLSIKENVRDKIMRLVLR